MNSEEWAKKFDELKGSEDQKAPEFHWVESTEAERLAPRKGQGSRKKAPA